MHDTSFAATSGQYQGELRVTRDGLAFLPVMTFDGSQMVLGIQGWQLAWNEIAGLERVAKRGGLRPGEPGGTVRVHYDGAARSFPVLVRASLRSFFDAIDAQVAAVSRVA